MIQSSSAGLLQAPFFNTSSHKTLIPVGLHGFVKISNTNPAVNIQIKLMIWFAKWVSLVAVNP